MRTASLLLFLCFSILSFAQSRTYKTRDGKKVEIEVGKEQSKIPNKWGAFLDVSFVLPYYSEEGLETYDRFRNTFYNFNLNGFYQINQELQVLGSLEYSRQTQLNQAKTNFIGFGLHGSYLLRDWTKTKTTNVKVGGSYQVTYVAEVPLKRTRRLEALAGFSHKELVFGNSYSPDVLENLPTNTTTVYLNNGVVNQLEVGVSLRTLYKSFLEIDRVSKKYILDNRINAKILIPITTSYNGMYYIEEPGNVRFEDFSDGDNFGPIARSIGFSLGYERYALLPTGTKKFAVGYNTGISYYPTVESSPVYIQFGFRIGLAAYK